MGKARVGGELRALVAPLLPPEPPKPKGGRPRVPDRACLTGIVSVLKGGIPRGMLPQEVGCGAGMTRRRRPRDRQGAGVRGRRRRVLLDRLGGADRIRIDWSRAALDSASVPARGGEASGPDPTDRGESGSERHVVAERRGIPLAATRPAADAHGPTVPEAAVDAVLPIKRPRGRPRRRPAPRHADKGDDSPRRRQALRRRRITPRIARRGIERSDRLGRHRWVAERTPSRLNRFRRLEARCERRADVHRAFLTLGRAPTCWNHLQEES